MACLSLDDFEWYETEFDRLELGHKEYIFIIATVRHYNGWRVCIFLHPSQFDPLHVDSLDAAQALAQIIASQNMESYSDYYDKRIYSRRTKNSGPPPFRAGVFQVD